MADTTYKSIHTGMQIDDAVAKVINHEAGIQGVKVDDTELTPDTENKVNIDTSTFNIPAVVQETGTSETDVMSQNAVTTAINDIDIPEVVQQTGTSIATVMSQNAVTNAIGDLVIPTVLQETGTSTTNVMSQKATTDSILNPNISSGNKVNIHSTTPLATNAVDVTLIDSTGTKGIGSSSVIIGGETDPDASENQTDLVSIGKGSHSRLYGVAVGKDSSSNMNGVAVGKNSSSSDNGVAIGNYSVNGVNGVTIGWSNTSGQESTTVGYDAGGKLQSVSLGAYSYSSDYGTAIGTNAKSGTSSDSNPFYSVSLGFNSTTVNNSTTLPYSVALGSYSKTTEASTVSVGDGTTNSNYGTRRIVNVKDPTNAQDVATKNYVDSKVAYFTATLPYASWTGTEAPYTKAVTVTGILSTDSPTIDLDLSSTTYSDIATIQSSWANVYRGVTSADTITFYASTVPTIDIPLQIKVVR